MATDATGATTNPDAIPTYNTSVDAPSGLGFNAAMAQIQVALSARINKPAGLVSGETPVYNGATFVRSSVTPLSANGLSGIGGLATGVTINGANTDYAWPGGDSTVYAVDVGTTGGTVRSISASTKGVGTRLLMRNGGGATLTLKHNLAGGTGFSLIMRNNVDVVLQIGEWVEFVQYGALWVECDRNVATVGAGITIYDRVVTDVTFNTDVTERTYYTKNIVGGDMNANSILRLTMHGKWGYTAGGDTTRVRLKFGATTVLDTGALTWNAGGGVTNGTWNAVVMLRNDGATGAQTMDAIFAMESTANFTTGIGRVGASTSNIQGSNTSVLDTTATQALVFTVQMGTSNAADIFTLQSAVLELM